MSDTYREINDLDQARAYIAALERDNAKLSWRLIQMGQFCQKLGGRPKDAYKKRRNWRQFVYMYYVLLAAIALMLWRAVEITNVTGCAG